MKQQFEINQRLFLNSIKFLIDDLTEILKQEEERIEQEKIQQIESEARIGKAMLEEEKALEAKVTKSQRVGNSPVKIWHTATTTRVKSQVPLKSYKDFKYSIKFTNKEKSEGEIHLKQCNHTKTIYFKLTQKLTKKELDSEVRGIIDRMKDE